MTKRVLHVIPRLGHGGAEHQLLMNVERLDRDMFESHVCHLFPNRALVSGFEDAGVPVHSAEVRGPLGVPGRVLKLARLIRSLKIDLVHTSNFHGEFYGGLAGRLAGVPVVGTLTNTAYERVRLQDDPNLNPAKLFAVRQIRKQVNRRTHGRFVAISEYVKESTLRELRISPDLVRVIYRGLPRDDGGQVARDPELVASLGLEDAFPVLLNVGRLVPQKGQRYLVEAMPEVLKAHPKARLLIVGSGFLEDDLKALSDRLGLDGSVQFLGRRDDVPDLMGVADMFVFPSLFEGLGVSLLEACSAGKACVATNVGPLPEVIEDGKSGVLVAPQDAAGLAGAINRLAGDVELMESLGREARRVAGRKFLIDRSVEQLESLYSDVLQVDAGVAVTSDFAKKKLG
ncbi:MAG: glycosyltransferase [Dehalococcoidia bacterium]